MDVLLLSRLQFAAAAMFHFLFVPLTLGLSVLVAIMETIYVRTGDETYKRMARFWGRLFVINFAVGVVTGITLEFQFGTNWSGYSRYVGDIFGSLLAIEATLAFFMESTFLAVWIFGWNRVSPKFHALSIWLVALASNISAFWILAANAWMQHPVGYTFNEATGRAELTDFLAVITQKNAVYEFIHTVTGAFILGAFFVMGISAYHLLKKNEEDFFRRSFKLASIWALVFAVIEVIHGHANGALVAQHQPAKLAAMEALWETQKGAPQTLILFTDEDNERNRIEAIRIPGALSLLAYHSMDAEVKGLKEWPKEDRPPVALTFWAFRVMVGLGFLFPALAAYGVFMSMSREFMEGRLGPFLKLRDWLEDKFPRLPWILVLAIPLPYVALEAGWMLAEVGRQPWIVHGVMRTGDAVSPIAASQVLTTLIGFVLVYGALGLADFFLLYKYAVRGPEPAGGPSGPDSEAPGEED